MKILYWTPLFWPEIGGTQTLVMNSLPALAERGYQVLVITSHGRTEQPDHSIFRGVPIERFPLWTALNKNDVHLILKIQRQITALKQDFRPDLIHIDFLGYTAFFHLATSRDYTAPTLVALHFDFSEFKTGQDTIFGQLLNKANWVTTVSQAILGRARQLIPEIAERSSTIYPFPGNSHLTPTPLLFDKPCILGIGRLGHEKGFDLLLNAIPFILDLFPEISVIIIGDGKERLSLEQQALSLGLEERIIFAGNIPNEDIPAYINKATLVVIPSRWFEAFGIVAVEAALMARPVVAANVGGLAEIVIDGETGLLVERENTRALADAIIKLLTQPEKAKNMGLAARSRAQQKFNQENYVDEYDRLYQSLVVDH